MFTFILRKSSTSGIADLKFVGSISLPSLKRLQQKCTVPPSRPRGSKGDYLSVSDLWTSPTVRALCAGMKKIRVREGQSIAKAAN
jgi:hypothetical protein